MLVFFLARNKEQDFEWTHQKKPERRLKRY